MHKRLKPFLRLQLGVSYLRARTLPRSPSHTSMGVFVQRGLFHSPRLSTSCHLDELGSVFSPFNWNKAPYRKATACCSQVQFSLSGINALQRRNKACLDESVNFTLQARLSSVISNDKTDSSNTSTKYEETWRREANRLDTEKKRLQESPYVIDAKAKILPDETKKAQIESRDVTQAEENDTRSLYQSLQNCAPLPTLSILGNNTEINSTPKEHKNSRITKLYYKGSDEHRQRLTKLYDKVLVVCDLSTAKETVQKLTTMYRNLVHACDTEVAKIDVKQETPVHHGEITCFSIYSGSRADFGDGKSFIWVDVLDGGHDVLMEFATFFEDPNIKKVWHNYSFDCHILENHGIKVSGFHADTMHLARLYDSSRLDGGYSLESLSSDLEVMSHARFHVDDDFEFTAKLSMKSLFGKGKMKKDGSVGQANTIAPVELLQREERILWICYSVLDSINTLRLYESLKANLLSRNWYFNGVQKGSMYNFYEEYWRPFGNLLVNMEAQGLLVDRVHLSDVEKVAVSEQEIAAARFRDWASKYCPDAKYMNVGSDIQIRLLFFGGTFNRKNKTQKLPESKTFKVLDTEHVLGDGKKKSKYRNITLQSFGKEMQAEIYTASGWPSVSNDALKNFAGKVLPGNTCLLNDRLKSDSNTKQTALNRSLYGTAYVAFGQGDEGKEACHAIAALCEVCSIDSLISNFILPLQGTCISGKNGRIHCSLNLNTETGRLSARRPNLQNQPALEKDRYKIRQAFIAEPGNSLIVADYGQLELRILAHLSNCQSMLEAFKAGGDFHSRTAMNMYTHVLKAVEDKTVLLEWPSQKGEEKPPVPLLKDAFAAERRKAKMLNFSIAYGKTPQGLSRDWKVSLKEAKETVSLWYKKRKEVLEWQDKRKKDLVTNHCVCTLLGRERKFPLLQNVSQAQRGHLERAAINTPVQGSAADVAMCAMLEIERNTQLKELGWKLLLQIHDEVILEGPTESAEIAKAIVVECMSKPFRGINILNVDLVVEAKIGQNWYAAK